MESARRGQSRPDDTYRARIVYDHGRITIDGDELDKPHVTRIRDEYRRGALVISSFYPEHGPAPEIWVKDIRINGQEIKLHDEDRKRGGVPPASEDLHTHE